MPGWLTVLAVASLAAAVACAALIALDILLRHRQRMWIMNLVWPLTALYAGPLALWAYRRAGLKSSRPRHGGAAEGAADGRAGGDRSGGDGHGKPDRPFPQSVALGAMHCGAGCTLGDLLAEWFAFLVPLSLFGRAIFAAWAVDYAAAFLLGIAFQYFTIKPMRGLSPLAGLRAAVKADALSLTSWQVGMYGWMAIATFALFDRELSQADPVFWLMMQVAMLCGFATAYPVNWWLLRRGVKETM